MDHFAVLATSYPGSQVLPMEFAVLFNLHTPMPLLGSLEGQPFGHIETRMLASS